MAMEDKNHSVSKSILTDGKLVFLVYNRTKLVFLRAASYDQEENTYNVKSFAEEIVCSYEVATPNGEPGTTPTLTSSTLTVDRFACLNDIPKKNMS